jgi:hypothetical protein
VLYANPVVATTKPTYSRFREIYEHGLERCGILIHPNDVKSKTDEFKLYFRRTRNLMTKMAATTMATVTSN